MGTPEVKVPGYILRSGSRLPGREHGVGEGESTLLAPSIAVYDRLENCQIGIRKAVKHGNIKVNKTA